MCRQTENKNWMKIFHILANKTSGYLQDAIKQILDLVKKPFKKNKNINKTESILIFGKFGKILLSWISLRAI